MNPLDWWRGLSQTARRVVAAVTVIVVGNIALDVMHDFLGGTPGGPTSSSYATGDDGLAAYAELLRRHDHPVRRLRAPVHETEDLRSGDTLVLADPGRIENVEADAVAAFVRAGGRVVAAGPNTAPVLRAVLGTSLEWSARDVRQAQPVAPAAEVAGIDAVRAHGQGAWRGAGRGLPVLADGGDVLVLVADVDRGRVVALADASPLHNRLLGEAGNAAFALAAVGEPRRPVVFAEAAHGYGRDQGLAGLPSSWQWGLALAAAAGLGWMWSKGRRFGPPDEPARELPPPRRVYVDAVAASLAKTKQPAAAVAPLQRAARARVASRAGLRPDAGGEELQAAARRLGLAEEEVRALTTVAASDDEILAAGRALAKLEGTRW